MTGLRLTMQVGVMLLAGGLASADDSSQRKFRKVQSSKNIVLVKHDVFDTNDERENNALYRLVNKLHIITKDRTIEKQLSLRTRRHLFAKTRR